MDQIDVGEDLAHARLQALEIATTLALYGQADVVERIGIARSHGFWDCDETRVAETVKSY